MLQLILSRTKLVLILSIVSCSLLISCAKPKPKIVTQIHTEIYVPTKITRPLKPTFIQLDSQKAINSVYNFKILQQNFVLLTEYSNQLSKTVDYYETSIDTLTDKKNELEAIQKTEK